MSETTTIAVAELSNLESRLRKLAEDKSHLQLVIQLMNRMSAVPGLENTIENMLRAVGDVIGGVNLILYYRVDGEVHYADFCGIKKRLDSIEDDLVEQAFSTREPVEHVHPFSDTRMLTPEFSKAYTWAVPLLVGSEVIGVLKMESLHLAMSELSHQLPTFFNYAALVLKNEVEGHVKHLEAVKLAAIVQSSDDAIIGKNLEGLVTSWNKGAERIYGYAAEEVVGRSVSLLVPLEREDELSRILARLKEGEHVEHYETVRRRKDGRDIHVSLTISPIKNAKGNIVGASTIARDITERIRGEEELRRVNRALRMLSDSNQTLIRAADEAELLNEICRTVVETGGYRMAWVGFAENDEEKALRPVAYAGVESGYLEKARLAWADVERGRGPGGIAVRTGRPCIASDIANDSAFAPWRAEAIQRGYRSMVALPLGSQGRTFGALSVYSAEVDAFDATELEILQELAGDLAFGIEGVRTRLAHARAETDLELFRQLTNQTTDAIFVVDPTTSRVLDVNDTGCVTLGYSREELLSLKVSDIDATVGNSAQWVEHLATVRVTGARTFESRHARKDGTTYPVEISVRCVAQNQREYLIAVVRDITERKLAEQDLRELSQQLDQRVRERTAQLEAANKELESFSYSVSHDLRAPLRAIDGFSQALLEDYSAKLDKEGRQHLHRVRAAAQRMGQLIDDMLSLSRVTRGEMRMEKVRLSGLAQEIAGELARREPERNVVFTIAPEAVVTGDSRFLRVALENLLGNAWKFTSKRPVARIEFGVTEQEGRRVYFVRDNGAGFNMQYADRLFAAFRRLHTTEEFPGTGVGLATVQRILHRHGGRVWAESETDCGATFFFTLP